MNTFAARLKKAIEKRGLSQTEAARICGIAQQSLNYIINNNLKTSKLAPKIASALKINPEWLVFGHGKFEETKIYELPIIHSVYMLKKYLHNQLDLNNLSYIVSDVYLGEFAFAYIIEFNKIAICSQFCDFAYEFLNIKNSTVCISKIKEKFSFPIFEWRIRCVDF